MYKRITVPKNLVDATPSVKQGYQWGIQQLGRVSANNLSIFLQALSSDLTIYLSRFDMAYNAFISANRMKRMIRSIQHGDQTKASAIPRIKYQNNNKNTRQFIDIMMEGHQLLSYIRTQLTGQIIETKFMVNTGNGVYLVNSSVISDAYKLVLSTYGATANSPFSLAYQLDIDMLQQLSEVTNQIERIDTNNIYQSIMNIKTPYLKQKTTQTGRRYKPVFNSKDAEIYDLMSQSGVQAEWLTLQRYTELRASMGGGGGYATSSVKLGDVGLQQDKYFGQNNNTVNFARQSLIRNNLSKLLTNIQMYASNPEMMKQQLLLQFTEKEHLITNEISKHTNQMAQQYIESLFI